MAIRSVKCEVISPSSGFQVATTRGTHGYRTLVDNNAKIRINVCTY
jgi:hypothetical protein